MITLSHQIHQVITKTGEPMQPASSPAAGGAHNPLQQMPITPCRYAGRRRETLKVVAPSGTTAALIEDQRRVILPSGSRKGPTIHERRIEQ